MKAQLRVAAHRLRNFLLMVAMHDYYYCILTGASPLLHKDKVPAEGAAHNKEHTFYVFFL